MVNWPRGSSSREIDALIAPHAARKNSCARLHIFFAHIDQL